MRFLFDTIAQDEHALALQWVLESRGHRADFLLTSEFPVDQGLSLHLSNSGYALTANHRAHPFAPGPCDGVVIRRRRGVTLSDMVARQDAEFARRQAKIVADVATDFVQNRGLWVNPPAERLRSNNKPWQLMCAVAAGLEIPETLISNDPDEIRRFVAGGGDVVHKPLQPAAWVGGEVDHLTFTGKVGLQEVEASIEALALTPAIFQRYVDKSFEVRAVFMGDQCFAGRIEARRKGKAITDWRTAYLAGVGLPLAHMTLPSRVHERCRDLMQRLGLLFGCFDFCVRPDGSYVFLEVNPMGQFLWMDRHPAFPMLSTFCDFLESQDPDFRSRMKPRDDYRFTDVQNDPAYKSRWEQSGRLRTASLPDPFTYLDTLVEPHA